MAKKPRAGAAQRSGREVSAWSVRRKIAVVLTLPVLLALVLGGVRVQAALSDAADATSTAGQAVVLGPAVSYLSAAEDAAIAHRSSTADDEAGRGDRVMAVDQAASELRRAADSAPLTEQQHKAVTDLLAGTDAVRDGSGYRTTADAVASLDTLGQHVDELVEALAATGPAASEITHVGLAVDGRLAATGRRLHLSEDADDRSVDGLATQVAAEAAALTALEQAMPRDDRVARLQDLNGGSDGTAADDTPARVYDDLTAGLVDDVDATLAGVTAGSRTEATVIGILVLVVLLIAGLLALLMARSVTRPIRRVREGVLAVTHEHLPRSVSAVRAGHRAGDVEPIDVTTDDDTGRLARAVDDLHRTAVRLAEEDAELRSHVTGMVAALNDRNATLVDEQLQLIEELELDEEDPQRLESLFLLDHLASRMRRTGDSLAVLADARVERGGEEPLSVTDVLHAATAGVRDYRRVTVAPAPSTRITGSAAADVVHLVGELLDNALTFSPASSEVRVITSTPGGMVMVEVHDAGPGIDQQRMTELNRELRAGGTLATAPTRDGLGLLVVSRLARRHGITVLLEDNADGGVTAQVFLPRPLLTSAVPDSGPVAVVPPVAEDVERADEVEPVEVVAEELRELEPVELEPVAELEPAADEPQHDLVTEVDPAAQDEPVEVVEEAPVVLTATEPVETAAPVTPLDPLEALLAANIGASAREPRLRPQALASAPVWETPAPVARPEQPVVTATVDTADSPDAGPAEEAPLEHVEDVEDVEVDENVEVDEVDEVEDTPAARVLSLFRTPVDEAEPADQADEIDEVDEVAEPVEEALVEAEAEAEAEQVADDDTDVPAEVAEAEVDGDTAPDETDVDAETDQTDAEVCPADDLDAPLGSGSFEGLDLDEDDDTPLFRMLRSSWFEGGEDEEPVEGSWATDETEAGWQAADRARTAGTEAVGGGALPVRRPGAQLVPGGLVGVEDSGHGAVRRDADAIRARLSAHASGVARGRATTAEAQSVDHDTEE